MPKYQRPWHPTQRPRGQAVEPPPLRSRNDDSRNWREQGPAAEVLALAVTPKARPAPVLEINRRPLNDLNALLEKYGEAGVCRELNVYRTTVRRWLSGKVALPGHQHQVIRLLLGHLPGTAGQWEHWSFYRGELISPAGEAYRAGDVMAIGLQRQRVAALEHELYQLRIRLAIAEQAVERLAPAANEARASA